MFNYSLTNKNNSVVIHLNESEFYYYSLPNQNNFIITTSNYQIDYKINMINQMRFKVPVIICITVVLISVIFYQINLPIQLDWSRTIRILLLLAFIQQGLYLILIYNEILFLNSQIKKLRLTNKYSIEQYELMKKKTTKYQLKKLMQSPQYQQLIKQVRKPIIFDSGSDSSQNQELTKYESHQIATKKKLF